MTHWLLLLTFLPVKKPEILSLFQALRFTNLTYLNEANTSLKHLEGLIISMTFCVSAL